MISISIKYTLNDYRNGYQAYYSNRINTKLDLIASILCCSFAIYLLIKNGFNWISCLLFIASFIFVFIVIASHSIIPSILFKRDHHVKGKVELEFNQDTIKISCYDFESILKWSMIKAAHITDKVSVLEYAGRILIIPHHNFLSDQLTDFHLLIKTHAEKFPIKIKY